MALSNSQGPTGAPIGMGGGSTKKGGGKAKSMTVRPKSTKKGGGKGRGKK